MNRIFFALSALVFLLSAPASPAAQPAGADQTPRLLHWPRFPVRVFVMAAGAAQKQEAQTALAGLDEWVAASGGRVRYALAASPAGADITVRFVPGQYLSREQKSVGETRVLYSGLTLKAAEIRLAEGNTVPGDLQSAAAHEFGHALGIQGHSDDPDDLMFPTETDRFSALGEIVPEAAHTVTARDLETLKACYPALFAPGG